MFTFTFTINNNDLYIMESATHVQDPAKNMNLEDYLIPGLPDSFYYIPNFITASEEAHLLTKVYTSTPSNMRPSQVL